MVPLRWVEIEENANIPWIFKHIAIISVVDFCCQITSQNLLQLIIGIQQPNVSIMFLVDDIDGKPMKAGNAHLM